MIPLSPVDEAFINSFKPFWKNLNLIVDAYFLFFKQGWYFSGIKEYDLISFFEYVVPTKETQALGDLVLAYKMQGTCSSLSYFSRAIFGNQSITIVDDSVPGAIQIDVQNANTLFNVAQLTADGGFAQMEADGEFAQLSTDVEDITGYDVFNLFKQLVMNGRTLISVTINS